MLWRGGLLLLFLGLICWLSVGVSDSTESQAGDSTIATSSASSSPSADRQKVIACVGDSITFGGDVAETDSYPSQLQDKLGDAYTVLNFGHSGATVNSHGDLPYIDQPEYTQALASQPDIVILMMGTNDARTPNDTPDLESTFESDYQSLAKSFADLPSHPVVYLVTPIRAVLDNEAQEALMESLIRPAIREVASRLGLPLIELESILGDNTDFYQPDGIHPTKAGYAVMSAAFVSALTAGRQSGLVIPGQQSPG